MVFLLFGSSASGKTTLTQDVVPLLEGAEGHDFDELEPPPGADTAWRHRGYAYWIERALELEEQGTDLILCGQTPLGELLAAADSTQLDAISACLIDCDDATRAARLEGRGGAWFARAAGPLQDTYTWPEWVSRHLSWADWLRNHARDPRYRQFVLHAPETEREMRWERWQTWTAGDPRWRVEVIDTTATTREIAARRLADWITVERALLAAGDHPLARGRWASGG
jgi:hypothetical protein